MKIWYHLIAAVVGLAIAALIVYLVFGSASQDGAVQEGDAPGSLGSDAAALCGSIPVAETKTAATRKLAAKNPPTLFSDVGPIAAISDDEPQQQAWVNRVHAASGLCIDELHIESTEIEIAMSTVTGVDDDSAGRLVGGVLDQAFTRPLNRPKVTVIANIEGDERTISVSSRAWSAFEVRLRQLKRRPTVANLKQFRAATGFKNADLRITGW